MSGRLSAILHAVQVETWALFVDDGVFAGAILAWLVLGLIGLPRAGLPPWLPGPLLFAGLAVILVAGALRACRKRGF
ncbi:MAG TPA: hypothetical protein VL752_19595 [Acidisoma sp.]|jgi:hypothetical protein|uniref:hypothetical protein n=1 Tax=Acidisoma sp. TaxID=1872115 RepID=UPI002CBB803F|nr:hypothetical protein [Acidisoma sp.]HTI03158.1 hypothetical protein [Acidisoma sp.]